MNVPDGTSSASATSSIKIAFIGRGTLSDNATTIRALGLGKELVRRGHRVSLFLPDLPKNRELRASNDSGIEFHLVGSRSMEFLPKLWAMVRHRFDVVHCLNVGLNSFVTGRAYCLVHRKALLVLDADEDMPMLLRPGVRRWVVEVIERYALRRAGLILCASKFLTSKFRERTAVPVEYLPYAVDPDLYTKHVSNAAGRTGASDAPVHILYMGTFQVHFDLPVLIHGVARALNAFPGLDLVMVGDGPERESLMRLAETVIPGRVKFPGFVPDAVIPEMLSSADLLVLPIEDTALNRSRCPNKVFQYMAARRPVITNRVGEVEAALGEVAHYFRYGSQEDFSRAIGEAVTTPRVVSIGQLMRNSWHNRTEEYLHIIARAIA